jgi:dTMP kinase
LIQKEVLKYLEDGFNIVYDRFELSTFTYQIYGRKREDLRDFILSLSKEVVPKDFVDRYYFFDLDVEISKERERSREENSDRFDAEGVDFFNRIRDGYKKEIANFPYKIIDASKNIEEVRKEFLDDLLEFLKK